MTIPRHLSLLLCMALWAGSVAAQDDVTLCHREGERGQTAACERAVAARPQDAELHSLLGQAYFASGFYPEGLQSFRQAIRVSKGDAGYRYRFAGYAALVNEYPQAAAELELAVLDTPKDVRLWTLLADCYRSMKDMTKTLRASRHAAELGDTAEAYALALHYGNSEEGEVNPKEELRWMERAATSGHAGAMHDLARLYAEGRPGIPPDPAKQKYWKDKARKVN